MADSGNSKDDNPKKEKRKSTTSDDGNSIPLKLQKLAENALPKPLDNQEKTTKSSQFIKSSINTAKKRQHPDDKDSTKKIKLDESDNNLPLEKKKVHRKRMKHTLDSVLEQMEFYFGDSSLSKDRFLKNLVDCSPDGYVDLCVFANFNKLQTLHKDGISQKILIQALSRSSMLQLNEDKTKVGRITPFKEITQEETDRRTVYVEHLPSHATHAWIKQIFSQCGKVAYVSLPTFKTTKQIKGFAFVEFGTSEEADKACMMLNNPLPEKAMEQPGKFPKGNKTYDRLQKLAPPVPVPDAKTETDPVKEKTDPSDPMTETEAAKKKKKKKKKKPQESSTDASVSAVPDTEAKEVKPEGKKKKKKRKRKLSHSKEQTTESETGAGGDSKETSNPSNSEQPKQQEESVTPAVATEISKIETETGDRAEELNADKTKKSVKVSEDEPAESGTQAQVKKRKKKRKKNNPEKPSTETSDDKEVKSSECDTSTKITDTLKQTCDTASAAASSHDPDRKLSHRERKLLRQEDIRRKRQERLESMEQAEGEAAAGDKQDSNADQTAQEEDGEDKTDNSQLTSILKLKKAAAEKKRVEFDPVLITAEFVAAKGHRRRKKIKREKSHLRVISKKEWLSLKGAYLNQQKSHMQALKESLRELRQQESSQTNNPRPQRAQPLDLEDVFGTKPLKVDQETKLANVEKMKFTPNVIVQWWCTHEMHRDKIRTMFKETHAHSIAYIDAKEEARSGYIRFKDEASAEEFAKLSRNSTSFMARVLPVEQQEEYWEKANRDRMDKLARKKKEPGSDRISRQVFQKNKATFFSKPSRIVFDEVEEEEISDLKKFDDDKANEIKTSSSKKDDKTNESETPLRTIS